jgi:uncharacterized SAM-binding protein YcdF (DUF218 family)
VTEVADLTLVGAFLARCDEPVTTAEDPADVLVLCGSAVLRSLTVAAEALRTGACARILVTGGIGHSTAYLREAVADHPTYRDTDVAGRTEAAILAAVLRHHLDVPGDRIWTEEEATHCGQNAEYSLRLLAARAPATRSLVVVQDPTMQRRTHASFDRWNAPDGPTVRSQAPFVPVVHEAGVGERDREVVWSLTRFRDLVLGEIARLTDDEHGYGPRGAGFIAHVDVPDEVAAAHRRLRAAYPDVPRAGPR